MECPPNYNMNSIHFSTFHLVPVLSITYDTFWPNKFGRCGPPPFRWVDCNVLKCMPPQPLSLQWFPNRRTMLNESARIHGFNQDLWFYESGLRAALADRHKDVASDTRYEITAHINKYIPIVFMRVRWELMNQSGVVAYVSICIKWNCCRWH